MHIQTHSISPSVSEPARFWVSQCKQDVTYFNHSAILHHQILTDLTALRYNLLNNVW